MFGQHDIDGVLDDEIPSVSPGLGNQRMATVHDDGQSQQSLQGAAGARVVDQTLEQHSAHCSGGFDMEVVRHPPGSITGSKGEEAPTEVGASDDLRARGRVENDSVHKPRAMRSSAINAAAVIGRSTQSSSRSNSAIHAARASTEVSSSGLTTSIDESFPKSSARRATPRSYLQVSHRWLTRP